MLKGSQITAFTFFLTSLFVAISTNVAYSKQTAEYAEPVMNLSERIKPEPEKCTPRPNRPCPICRPGGCTSPSHRPSPPIPITRPELINVTSTVAIEKLEALKSSGQATGDDYLLLGYFYSLEGKYDLSEANYLKALELATDTEKKAIAEQELQEVRAATQMQEVLRY